MTETNALMAERTRRDAIQRGVVVLLVATAALVVLGVIMVFSATAPSSIRLVDADPSRHLFTIATRQVMWVVAGLAAALVIIRVPYQFTRKYAKLWLGAGCVLQLLVFAQGSEGVGGNNNWLNLGPVSIQPSEFLKLAMIVWLAQRLAQLTQEEMRVPRKLLCPAVGFLLPVGLVGLGGDLGTALVFGLIAFGMFWYAGIRSMHLLLPVAAASAAAGMMVILGASRRRRVFEYFSNLFTLPDSHNPTQSDLAQFAFGSGGVTGVGIGAGKEKWRDLAEAHTDFIFAVIGEELGLLGALTVVVLFLALGWAFIQIAVNHPSRYARLLVLGAALWICGQGFANMFVVTGLLPVFGVPLPFVSMGGSSMIAALMMVGAVISLALAVPGVKDGWRLRGKLTKKVRTLVRSK